MENCFYRVLESPSHKDGLTRRMNSSHHRPAGEWGDIFNRSNGAAALDEYPLKTSTGTFSPRALDAYLRFRKQCRANGTEPLLDVTDSATCFAIGELAGVYVFRSPYTALRYRRQLSHAIFEPEFVVLTGTEVYTAAVEEDSTLLKDWAVVDGPMSTSDFEAKYGV